MTHRAHLFLALFAALGFGCSLVPLLLPPSPGWWGTRAGTVTSGVCLGVNGFVFLQNLAAWLATRRQPELVIAVATARTREEEP